MFRASLVVYLTLATVLGPVLCCCNAQRLFSSVEGSKCCRKGSAAQVAHNDAHDHGHAHHEHQHPPTPDAANSQSAPVRHEHDDESCPCGKHHVSLVVAVPAGMQLKAADLQTPTWYILVALLPALPEIDAQNSSINAQVRPADLYGREILRAYQIMRC